MRHLVVVLPLVAACVTDAAAPSGPDSMNTSVQLGGTYQLANRIDLTTAGVLPDLASSTLKSLSKLKEDPAGAIIGILQASNAPVVSTLLSALPDVIKQQLAQLINNTVFAALYDGVPVTQNVAGILDDVASLVTRFQLDTKLDLATPDHAGKTMAQHAVAGVTFTVADKSLVVTAPMLLSDVTHGSCSAFALHVVEQADDVPDGLLDLKDHAIGLPIGEFIVQGVDQLVMAKFGQPNLRAALGAVMNCSGLAHGVATKCIGPVCVGHETEIRNVCEAGLDALVADIQAQLRKLDIKALDFKSGEAYLWDAPVADGELDGQIDRIDRGAWQLAIDLGAGPHPTSADFTGFRLHTDAQPQ